MSMPPRTVELLGWLGLCAALTYGIGTSVDWGRQIRLGATATPVAGEAFAAPCLAPPYVTPPADTYLEISARPLWVADRAATPAQNASAAPTASAKDRFVLTGTMVFPEGRFAHFVEKSGNRSRTVAQGKDLAPGLTVRDIEADRVVVVSGDAEETLPIQSGGIAPAGRRSAPATPRAQATAAVDAQPAVPAASGEGTNPASATSVGEQATQAAPPAETAPTARAKRPARQTGRLPFPWEMTPAKNAGNGNEKK